MAGVKGMKGCGGRRPGSGRKLGGSAKKVQVTITITPEQRDDLAYLKSRAVDTNAVIGKELHRLAIAYELADAGIV